MSNLSPLPSRTVLLIEDGVIHETQTGLAWSDALEMVWTGQRKAPLRVVELDLTRGTATDRTLGAARELAARAVHKGFTPECLDRFFDQVFVGQMGSIPMRPLRAKPRLVQSVS